MEGLLVVRVVAVAGVVGDPGLVEAVACLEPSQVPEPDVFKPSRFWMRRVGWVW